MVLDVSAGLPAQQASAEGGEHVGVAAAVKKEALVFAQTNQVHPGLEKIATPIVRNIALDAQCKRRARRDGKRCDGVGGGQHAIGTGTLIERGGKQGLGREPMQPGQDRSLLAQVALRVTPNFLVVADVRLLEIIAPTDQQKFDAVVVSRVPVKLYSGAGSLAEIVQLAGLGWIEKAP